MTADWQTWNDGTVPKLAQTIFDSRRFDLLPILADALEESGWPGDIPPFRTAPPPVLAVRLLAPIVGGELAAAVKWLENLAAELGPQPEYSYDSGEDDEYIRSFSYPAKEMDYEHLLGYAKDWVDHGDHTIEQGSEHWRDTFDDDALVAEFWKNYQIVTGEPVENPESFFGCSC